jgi:hypothetical protein
MTERGQGNFPLGSGRSPASVHRIVRIQLLVKMGVVVREIGSPVERRVNAAILFRPLAV